MDTRVSHPGEQASPVPGQCEAYQQGAWVYLGLHLVSIHHYNKAGFTLSPDRAQQQFNNNFSSYCFYVSMRGPFFFLLNQILCLFPFQIHSFRQTMTVSKQQENIVKYAPE